MTAATLRAWFFDGETPTRHDAVLSLGPAGLVISTGGTDHHLWPYARIAFVDDLPDGSARLGLPGSDARLIVSGATYSLIARETASLQPRRRQQRALGYVALSLLAVAALVAAVWLGWPVVADQIAKLLPGQVTEAIGQTAAEQLIAGRRICAGRTGQAALQDLVNRLARGAPGERFEVRVIDSPDINAFAAPGGHIVILNGLLATATSPDEVAGVLAHEMGHVIERHSLRLLVRYAGLVAVGEMLLGDSNLASFGPLLVTLSYSRGFEAQADQYGITLLGSAGLSTGGLAQFFARMEAKEKRGELSGALRYLASHPPTHERREALEKLAKPGAPTMTNAEWQALRRICE